MGQQQLFLLILGFIVVGLAIIVGIIVFSNQGFAANRDAIYNDLTNLGAAGFQYKITPSGFGGGNGTYRGYVLDSASVWGPNNPNAVYEVLSSTDSKFSVKATSKMVEGATVEMTFDASGKMTEGPLASGF